MPDIPWLLRREKESTQRDENSQVANMDALDYAVLLEEIEHH